MQLAPLAEARAELQRRWAQHARTQEERDSRSAPSPGKTAASVFLARQGAAVLAFLVGTGGLGTAHYITQRDERGYRFGEFEYAARNAPTTGVKQHDDNAAAHLSRVRAVLAPSVTDLATVFGVSRQTIYNWQAGQPIAQVNEERLQQLARAADFISNHGLGQKPSLIRRKVSDGKSFFELVRDGSDPETVARLLVETVQREMDQRKRLDARLANRPRKRVDLDEIGAAALDENT